MKRMKRRAMLKGTLFGGTVAIGLPMLDAMMPRHGGANRHGTEAHRLLVHGERHAARHLEPAGQHGS